MNKIQYINYLKIKGIEELPKGESIGSIMESVGEPTTEEMVKVNEMTFKYFIKENNELEEELEKLKNKNKSMVEEVSMYFACIENDGVTGNPMNTTREEMMKEITDLLNNNETN